MPIFKYPIFKYDLKSCIMILERIKYSNSQELKCSLSLFQLYKAYIQHKKTGTIQQIFEILGGLLGPRMVRVSGMAETE